jgi:hypothetical protein
MESKRGDRSFSLRSGAVAIALIFGLARFDTVAVGQVVPDCPELEVDLPAVKVDTLAVRGLVIDATTRRPISRFRVIPGALLSSGVTWQPHLITHHQRGRFTLPPNERAWDKTQFRVEAEGYRPGISRVVKKSEKDAKLVFALEADAGISAIVRTPGGAPAAGAEAAWVTLSREATAHGSKVSLSGHAASLGAEVSAADDCGRIWLAPESDPGTIIVAHGSGYAEIKPNDLKAAGVVTLKPWCRVEGQVLSGRKPVAGQGVWVYRTGPPSGDAPSATWQDEAISDADGRFVCEHVVAGRQIIDRVFATETIKGTVHGLSSVIEVREDRPTSVSLGGPGRTLVGRFEPPKNVLLPIDWSKVRGYLYLDAPHIGLAGDEPIWKSFGAFLATEEGKNYNRDNITVHLDGSFEIESVPPGRYHLSVSVTGRAVGRPADYEVVYAVGHASVEVSAMTPGRNDDSQPLGTVVLRTGDAAHINSRNR